MTWPHAFSRAWFWFCSIMFCNQGHLLQELILSNLTGEQKTPALKKKPTQPRHFSIFKSIHEHKNKHRDISATDAMSPMATDACAEPVHSCKIRKRTSIRKRKMFPFLVLLFKQAYITPAHTCQIRRFVLSKRNAKSSTSQGKMSPDFSCASTCIITHLFIPVFISQF